jgi:hypothetical protein
MRNDCNRLRLPKTQQPLPSGSDVDRARFCFRPYSQIASMGEAASEPKGASAPLQDAATIQAR